MNATFFERLGAYIIDSIIVSMILVLICQGLPNTETEAEKRLVELENQLQSGEITPDEYLEAYTDNELQYEYKKESVLTTGISVALTFAYFVIFQYMNKGQTLGKKLLKIKVVDKDSLKPTTILKGLLRSLFVLSIASGIIGILLLYIIDKQYYIKIYFTIVGLESVFFIVTLIFMIYKKDGRGLHDIMANTIVIKERG